MLKTHSGISNIKYTGNVSKFHMNNVQNKIIEQPLQPYSHNFHFTIKDV